MLADKREVTRSKTARVDRAPKSRWWSGTAESEKKVKPRASTTECSSTALWRTISGLRQSELQLLLKYSAESRFVEVIRAQIRNWKAAAVHGAEVSRSRSLRRPNREFRA
jgi:hypothetical protein